MRVDRPPGIDVTRNNPREFIYIKGDADTDGSLRLIPDITHEGDHVEFQLRANGVWNITSIDLSGQALTNIGDGLTIGAAGPHILTEDPRDNSTYLHGRSEFNDTVGSAEASVSPIVSAKVIDSIRQPDDTGSMFGNSITWTTMTTTNKMLTKLYLHIDTPPTSTVTLMIHDTDENGSMLFMQNYGALDWGGGIVSLELHGWVNEEVPGSTMWYNLAVADSGTVGLFSNISGTIPWYAIDYHTEAHQHLAAMEFTMRSMLLDRQNPFEPFLTRDGDTIHLKPTIEL